ncbi:transposase [Listeria sp. FSL L7-1485]|uniref:Transposase n=1 Tax=Listeria immobilis TaxID=2713502 RepID=A0A7X1C8E2_9LIST|nr:transposase [Listeria immobilis]MBC1535590.1 transposase [Listeria immobilis]
MDKRLKDAKTKKIYAQRKVDMEPAFGDLKASLRFTHLSVRGREKVKNELGFALLAVNLRKYTARGCQNKGLYFYSSKNQKRKSSYTIFASGFYLSRLISLYLYMY